MIPTQTVRQKILTWTAGLLLLGLLAVAGLPARAQEPPGPQSAAPPPVEPAPPLAPRATGERVTVPAGTKLPVILENGISTHSAKPGDSVYFQTAFPVTQDNRIIIPVGSYVRGAILEAKRPGRVKGRGEIRLRLDTLILPNGYTINLNAAPTSGDTGGKEKVDSEGKIEGDSSKGRDVATVASTAGQGAIIGAIAGRTAKGAGIGAGIGGAVGLAAVLLTRGPEVELPRGSTLDIVLERSLTLDADKLHFNNLGQMPRQAGPESGRPRRSTDQNSTRQRRRWPFFFHSIS